MTVFCAQRPHQLDAGAKFAAGIRHDLFSASISAVRPHKQSAIMPSSSCCGRIALIPCLPSQRKCPAIKSTNDTRPSVCYNCMAYIYLQIHGTAALSLPRPFGGVQRIDQYTWGRPQGLSLALPPVGSLDGFGKPYAVLFCGRKPSQLLPSLPQGRPDGR
jgi:hypothetical protein